MGARGIQNAIPSVPIHPLGRILRLLCAAVGLAAPSAWMAESPSREEPRVYRIAVQRDSAPLSQLTPNGQPEGFSIDLLKEISRRSGVRFEIIPAWWRVHLAKFRAGEIDALSGIGSESQDVDGLPIENSIRMATVRAVSLTMRGKPPTRVDELRGRRVGVSGASVSLSALRKLNLPDTQILVYSDAKALAADLRSGACDVAVSTYLGNSGIYAAPGLQKDFLSDLSFDLHIAGEIAGCFRS